MDGNVQRNVHNIASLKEISELSLGDKPTLNQEICSCIEHFSPKGQKYLMKSS